MPRHTPLKLIAFAAQDLAVVSAMIQDAVTIGSGMLYDRDAKRFMLEMSRYCWEKKRRLLKPRGERVKSILQINTVKALKSRGIDPRDTTTTSTLNLLALRLDGDKAIEITFSAGAAIRLEIEAVDVLLTDVGEPFAARKRPTHPQASD